MRRAKKIERIGCVVDRVLKASGIEDLVLEETIISRLPEILDKRIVKHIKSYHIEDKILFIKLNSPVWARELLFFKKELQDRINESVGKKYIKNIMFNA